MLLLIDASNLIHRVLRTSQLDLVNTQGIRTGGIHGFIKSIHKLCRESNYTYFPIVCWDEGAIKFRQAIYSGYKDHKKIENRDSMPWSNEKTKEQEDEELFLHTLFWTKTILHTSILPLLGIPSVMVPGVEADDILAFMSLHLREKALILTNDADLFQLITDDVRVHKPVTELTYDKARLIEEYNLIPERYRDHFVLIKAMVGGEDGIPHLLKGLGGKGASKIARKFILEEPLNPKIKNEIEIVKYLDDIARNLKLMDLHYFQNFATEEVYQIRQRFSNCILSCTTDEFKAYKKFDDLELRDIKEFVPDLCESGSITRSRLTNLVRSNYAI